jgi:hypothetical protein
MEAGLTIGLHEPKCVVKQKPVVACYGSPPSEQPICLRKGALYL